MASRRDLFQSYQFMVQRVVSGLVLGETDPAQTPLRRMGGAAFGGVMIAVLSLAVAGVIGVISPGGNTTWKTAGKVIVEADTGARFVWVPDQSKVFHLHPVLNYASAALLTGTTETIEVSAASLEGAPRGPRLGIGDAPDSLPSPKRLLPAPWTLCSLPAVTKSGEQVPNTALTIGQGTSLGTKVGESAVLVRDIDTDSLHLVWKGHQYPIEGEDAVLSGLALGSEPQIKVGTAWLSALPTGDTIAPKTTTAPAGQASAAFAGAVTGQVADVESGVQRQYYLIDGDTLVSLTELQAQVQLADPATRSGAYAGGTPSLKVLSASDANQATQIDLPPPAPTDAPTQVPKIAGVDSTESTVCASFSDATAMPQVSVEASAGEATEAAVTTRQTAAGTVLADQVKVEPGWGTIVRSKLSTTDSAGSTYLVTDDGRRYAVTDDKALKALGYDGVTPVEMPASLVSRIPAGAALDQTAAGQYG